MSVETVYEESALSFFVNLLGKETEIRELIKNAFHKILDSAMPKLMNSLDEHYCRFAGTNMSPEIMEELKNKIKQSHCFRSLVEDGENTQYTNTVRTIREDYFRICHPHRFLVVRDDMSDEQKVLLKNQLKMNLKSEDVELVTYNERIQQETSIQNTIRSILLPYHNGFKTLNEEYNLFMSNMETLMQGMEQTLENELLKIEPIVSLVKSKHGLGDKDILTQEVKDEIQQELRTHGFDDEIIERWFIMN
jgi:hypothetical protein